MKRVLMFRHTAWLSASATAPWYATMARLRGRAPGPRSKQGCVTVCGVGDPGAECRACATRRVIPMRRAENAAALVALLDGEIRRRNRAFWIAALTSGLCALLLAFFLLEGW